MDNTTDKELLTLAAKAAGHVLVWGDKYKLGDDEIDCTDIPYIRSGQPDEGDVFWDPRNDDGDAFRLAVKLNMQIVITGYELEGVGITDCKAGLGKWAGGSLHNGDPLAATRLAIVRAAAEIGRAMP